MTDLAHLKSLIATFANGSAPAQGQPATDWRDDVLASLAPARFDAVLVTAGEVSSTYGDTQDLVTFSKSVSDESGTDARLLVYSCPDQTLDLLVCASRCEQTIIVRTASEKLALLLRCWSSTG